MQIVVVSIAIVMAIAYAVWRIRRAFHAAADPCASCPGCALKDAKSKKMACEKKKDMKKFGRTEKIA